MKKALGYIDFLNTSETSPWKNKIRMANTDSKDSSINQKSFVKAIKKYILVADNPLIAEHLDYEKQHKIFENYWNSIIDIIGNDQTSVLFKYNGVFLFSMFYIPFLHKLRNEQDYTITTMKKLLEHAFENSEGIAAGIGHNDFWIKGGKASGLNTGALAKINAEMVTSLHRASDVIDTRSIKI